MNLFNKFSQEEFDNAVSKHFGSVITRHDCEWMFLVDEYRRIQELPSIQLVSNNSVWNRMLYDAEGCKWLKFTTEEDANAAYICTPFYIKPNECVC